MEDFKKYFDEPHEIAGWIVAALGVALFCVALFVSAVPRELAAVGAPVATVGLGMVSKKFVAVLERGFDILEKLADKQDDKSEES
jgi:hypothetical protein